MKPKIVKEINGLFWIQAILLVGTILITIWMSIYAKNYSTHFLMQRYLSADINDQHMTVASETGRSKEDAIKLAKVLNSEVERGNNLLAQTWMLEYRLILLIGIGFAIMSLIQMRILQRCRKHLLEPRSE